MKLNHERFDLGGLPRWKHSPKIYYSSPIKEAEWSLSSLNQHVCHQQVSAGFDFHWLVYIIFLKDSLSLCVL